MVQDKGKLVHAHPANELTEKLFGIETVINEDYSADADAVIFTVYSTVVLPGKIQKITYLTAYNLEGGISSTLRFSVYRDTTEIWVHYHVGAIAIQVTIDFPVEIYLQAGDRIGARFDLVGIGEECHLNIFGYEMNAP